MKDDFRGKEFEFTDFSEVTQEMVDDLKKNIGANKKEHICCFFDDYNTCINGYVCKRIIKYSGSDCPCNVGISRKDLLIAANIFLDVWESGHREKCPDCDRPKAFNVVDVSDGYCPKWWLLTIKKLNGIVHITQKERKIKK